MTIHEKKYHNDYVNKKILYLSALLVAVLIVPNVKASGSQAKVVLGDTTQNYSLPPTTSGPGFILPNSPFYFLDKLKQKIRINLAINSEERAQVYADIAGERFAEARFMLLAHNNDLAEATLEDMRSNTKNAAIQLQDAMLRGVNVQQTAKKINDSIKEQQKALDVLESQATAGEMKAVVTVTQATLADAKGIVDEGLAKADLDNEVRYDMARATERSLSQTEDDATQLQADLQALQQQAIDAAKNNQTNREDALKTAIAQKDQQLKAAEIAAILAESKKQEALLQLQGNATAQAADIVKKTQEVARTVELTQQANVIGSSKN